MSDTNWRDELPGGWAFPPGSRKCHWFPARETDSLCGRWGFQMTAAARQPDEGKSADDCAACRRKLDAAAPVVPSDGSGQR